MAAKNTSEPVEAEIVSDDALDGSAVARTSVTDVKGAIQGLNDASSAHYTSIKGDDFAAKKRVAAALTSSEPIDEHLGETIELVDLIVLPVDLADDDGNINTAPRVILIAKDGAAYHATSVGLLSSVRNLFASVGEPDTWPEALPIKVVEAKGKRYKYFTMQLV